MPPRVLIADDEPDSLLHIQELLRPLGLELIVARSGEEALAKVRGSLPDLILTDVVMPGIGGFGLIKALKSEEKYQKVPILVFTARAKMKDTLLSMGIEGVISKPYADGDLVSQIRTLLKLAPEPQTASSPAASPAVPVAEKPLPPPQASVPDQTALAAPAASAASGETKPQGPDPAKTAEVSTTPAAGPAASLQRPRTDACCRAALLGGAMDILTRIQALLAQVKCQSSIIDTSRDMVERTAAFDPDLVILDVITEGMPARDIIKRMRKAPALKAKKVLVFSHIDKEKVVGADAHKVSLDIEASKTFCMEAGADDYLGTFDEARFIENVRKHLKKA